MGAVGKGNIEKRHRRERCGGEGKDRKERQKRGSAGKSDWRKTTQNKGNIK